MQQLIVMLLLQLLPCLCLFLKLLLLRGQLLLQRCSLLLQLLLMASHTRTVTTAVSTEAQRQTDQRLALTF